MDGLVSTGFVTREPHPSDRRATLVTFTPRGSAAAQRLVEGHRRLARQLFEELPIHVFDGFDDGVVHVIRVLRSLTAPESGSR